MNRSLSLTMRVLLCAFLLGIGGMRTQAQNPPAPSTPPTAQAPADASKDADKDKKDDDDDGNPFAPEPAPALPPGMKGSDASDPRAKLTPGLYDAGETSKGMKHLALIKKPDAFQLGTSDPEAAKVKKVMEQLGINDPKIPKEMNLVIAQLAFANSDLAFQGNHLFQGNFYGMNIFDISNPANAKLLTSMVCPGGQGDVSVYKNLMFMSVEMPNGRLDCGVEGFPAEPPPADEDKDKDKASANDKDKDQNSAGGKDSDKSDKDDKDKEKKHPIPVAQKDRFRGVRIFDISDISNPKQVAAV